MTGKTIDIPIVRPRAMSSMALNHTVCIFDTYRIVTPSQVSYSDVSPEGAILVNVTQLGPPVDVSFVVRNAGPSQVPNIQLDIQWPLNSVITGENYYFYITSIQVLS